MCSLEGECEHIQRLCKILVYYEIAEKNEDGDEMLDQFFSSYYSEILNDYGHVIYHHLDGSRNRSNHSFQAIYEQISMVISCDIQNCSCYARNSRNRQNENSDLITDSVPDSCCDSDLNSDGDADTDVKTAPQFNMNINSKSIRTQYYYEVLDAIHCHLLHSFDLGFRVNCDVLGTLQSSLSDSTPVDYYDEYKENGHYSENSNGKHVRYRQNRKIKIP